MVDTSVWIDLFAGRSTPQTAAGRHFLATGAELIVGDLILVEVLQGTRDERDLSRKADRLAQFSQVQVVDSGVVLDAARNYQRLRELGVTPRKTIDTLIATRCIRDNIPLLFADRDFRPFVEHLNLRSALGDTGLN